MSDTTLIEKRAIALDEARKVRLVKSGDIDVERYAKPSEIERQVKEASEWLFEIAKDYEQPDRAPKVYLPWDKTRDKFDFKPGEVTIYAGANGGGKSLATGQIALGLIQQKQRVCIASFEMKPKRTLNRMLRQFAGYALDGPGFDQLEKVTRSIVDFSIWSEGHLWLYDQQGSVNARQVVAMTRYCAVELGIKHVFIDSLMKCVSAEDAYNEQKGFVDELTAVARDHQIHVHLIHHIRKQSSEESMPNKMDIKGTGSITDQVDNVFIWWRNKKKEHQLQNNENVDVLAPDAIMMCEKQRNGEDESWYSMWYDKESQQFWEIANSGAIKWGKQ
jgi:twinkle protein